MQSLAFRLGGIPVKVDPSFWIIMGLFGLQRAVVGGGLDLFVVVEWIALVFVGILVHELGHAVAFRSFGRTPSVVLYAMGGLTSADGRLSPGRRLVSTLAGPAVGMVLGGAVVLAAQAGAIPGAERLAGAGTLDLVLFSLGGPLVADGMVELVVLDLVFINVGWGLLNLVPLFPLDGGQSLEALLQLLRIPLAEHITSVVSVTVAAGAGWWAAQNQQIFLLLIAGFLGLVNLRRLGALRRGEPAAAPSPAPSDGAGPFVTPQLQRTMGMAEKALEGGRPGEAVELVAQEYRLRPSAAAGEAYAAVLTRARDLDEAEQLVAQDHRTLSSQALATLAALLVAGGRYEAALRAAEAGWNADADGNREGHWHHAVSAAAARAGLRDVDGAVRWLYTAADRGWSDQRRLESDPVFAEVRADPRIADILTRMRA